MAETAAKKENFFVRAGKGVTGFFRDIRNEVKKIVWPTPKSVFRNTGVVLATIIIIGLFIFGLDFVFTTILSHVMELA